MPRMQMRRFRTLQFGRRQPFVMAMAAPAPAAIGDDIKLFATTFIGGLLFMSVYLA